MRTNQAQKWRGLIRKALYELTSTALRLLTSAALRLLTSTALRLLTSAALRLLISAALRLLTRTAGTSNVLTRKQALPEDQFRPTCSEKDIY